MSKLSIGELPNWNDLADPLLAGGATLAEEAHAV